MIMAELVRKRKAVLPFRWTHGFAEARTAKSAAIVTCAPRGRSGNGRLWAKRSCLMRGVHSVFLDDVFQCEVLGKIADRLDVNMRAIPTCFICSLILIFLRKLVGKNV